MIRLPHNGKQPHLKYFLIIKIILIVVLILSSSCTARTFRIKLTNEEKSEKLNEEGRILLHQGRFKESISKFNSSIQLNPKNSKAFSNRSIAYKQLGKIDEGINDLDIAIKLDPNNPINYANQPSVKSCL